MSLRADFYWKWKRNQRAKWQPSIRRRNAKPDFRFSWKNGIIDESLGPILNPESSNHDLIFNRRESKSRNSTIFVYRSNSDFYVRESVSKSPLTRRPTNTTTTIATTTIATTTTLMTNATQHVTNAVTRVSEMSRVSEIPRRLSTFLIGVKEKCSNQIQYNSIEHKLQVSLFWYHITVSYNGYMWCVTSHVIEVINVSMMIFFLLIALQLESLIFAAQCRLLLKVPMMLVSFLETCVGEQ